MKTLILKETPTIYPHNIGAQAEITFINTFTNTIQKLDNKPFNKTNDFENISIKSARFTLASANINAGNTKEEKINDFFKQSKATEYAYVTKDFTIAYIMNKNEFYDFIIEFTTLQKESTKNGGGLKLRAKSESKAMKRWLEIRAAI